MPDSNWPNLPDYSKFSEADHAAHRTKRGIHRPEDLLDTNSRKFSKQLLKVVRKPHLTTKKHHTRRVPRRKRKEP